MRIRSTKPEFWRSERIASVSWDARLVLKGLESYVDDNGAGKDDLALIVGDLFQRDLVREPSRTLARVSEALTDLAEAGLLHRYSADGTELLYLSFWESFQRVDKPQSGRFPRPDGTLNYKDSVIRESVANPREPSRALAPGTGEQGNRGTAKNTSAKADERPTFNDFYSSYPRKEARRDAERAWKSAIKRATPQTIIDGLRQFRFSPEQRFIPMPATWLNQDRWADGQSTSVPGTQSVRTFSRQELDEILGPDSWQLPAPPADLDPEADGGAAYRRWAQEKTAEHRADRVQQAIAQLARQAS